MKKDIITPSTILSSPHKYFIFLVTVLELKIFFYMCSLLINTTKFGSKSSLLHLKTLLIYFLKSIFVRTKLKWLFYLQDSIV